MGGVMNILLYKYLHKRIIYDKNIRYFISNLHFIMNNVDVEQWLVNFPDSGRNSYASSPEDLTEFLPQGLKQGTRKKYTFRYINWLQQRKFRLC